jgi:hypothetical protein
MKSANIDRRRNHGPARAQGGSVRGTNSDNLDRTTRQSDNSNEIINTNDGSGNLVAQMYHGTPYIDELVGMRLEHGRVYVHQDERSECEPAATGKASTTRASGRHKRARSKYGTPNKRTCPAFFAQAFRVGFRDANIGE